MLGNLGGMHLVVVLALVLLFFGAGRLPALAKSLGQSIRVLKRETEDTTAQSDDREPPGSDRR